MKKKERRDVDIYQKGKLDHAYMQASKHEERKQWRKKWTLKMWKSDGQQGITFICNVTVTNKGLLLWWDQHDYHPQQKILD